MIGKAEPIPQNSRSTVCDSFDCLQDDLVTSQIIGTISLYLRSSRGAVRRIPNEMMLTGRTTIAAKTNTQPPSQL